MKKKGKEKCDIFLYLELSLFSYILRAESNSKGEVSAIWLFQFRNVHLRLLPFMTFIVINFCFGVVVGEAARKPIP